MVDLPTAGLTGNQKRERESEPERDWEPDGFASSPRMLLLLLLVLLCLLCGAFLVSAGTRHNNTTPISILLVFGRGTGRISLSFASPLAVCYCAAGSEGHISLFFVYCDVCRPSAPTQCPLDSYRTREMWRLQSAVLLAVLCNGSI